jgi:hypothetical protein
VIESFNINNQYNLINKGEIKNDIPEKKRFRRIND